MQSKTGNVPKKAKEESDEAAAAEMTRRVFLKRTAAASGLAAVATVGGGALLPGSVGVTFPEQDCGDGGGPRVLVAYASDFGTTGEVAAAVAEVLCGRGATAHVRRIRDVTDPAGYDATVIGGAIQYDRWMSEANEFVHIHEAVLSEMPVAYFLTCMTLSRRSAGAEAKAAGYADKLRATSAVVDPVDVGRFAGVVDYGRMSWPTRIAARLIFTVMGVREGDYRDWDAIRAWAGEVSDSLI